MFNSCNTDTLKGIPKNFVGYQYPANGNGYAGLMTDDAHSGWREYYAVRLANLLIPGVKYYVSIKISLAECSNYACNNFGIGFAVDSFWKTSLLAGDSLSHYLKINSSLIITDTINWTSISGSFVSDSAYKFVVIGNFLDFATTDTILNNNSCLYKKAYYYIDDVCVSTDSLNCNSPTGLQQVKQNVGLSLFPNPFSSQLTFSLSGNSPWHAPFLYPALCPPPKTFPAREPWSIPPSMHRHIPLLRDWWFA